MHGYLVPSCLEQPAVDNIVLSLYALPTVRLLQNAKFKRNGSQQQK